MFDLIIQKWTMSNFNFFSAIIHIDKASSYGGTQWYGIQGHF